MLIKSVSLKNIRSYTSQKIEFPEGSVMLSGDIGSGKSTILLAAEFALFGIMKGDVSGESLLRNGKNEGSVELCLELGGKDVVIGRTLKRSKQGVKQEAGFITVGGVRKDATSTELKAAVLNLLGYPRDLLAKSKGLIYRYTVYTPQEEMKKILFDDEEARLNTLRRVFDVDKYRLIRENAKLYLYELKAKSREAEASASDIDEKKAELKARQKDASEIDAKIAALMPSLDNAKALFESSKTAVSECENELKALAEMKKGLAVCEAELNAKLGQRQRNSSELALIEKRLEILRKESEGKEELDFSAELKKHEAALKAAEDERLSASRKFAELNARKRASAETKDKISRIDMCPLCLQNVSDEHKKGIGSRADIEIAEIESGIMEFSQKEKDAASAAASAKSIINETRKKQLDAASARAVRREISDKESRQALLNSEQEELKKSIGLINTRKMSLSSSILAMAESEQKHESARQAHEKARTQLHMIDIDLGKLGAEKKSAEKAAESLITEIKKKESILDKSKSLKKVHHWLESSFTPLMALMEKEVMGQVYHSFNSLFQKWFSALMEDESVTARLDSSFTPVVQQNGYDTSISFLSGGEKTSCALAYRLALNKVINDMVSGINTKDLIILDEPTDGFSSEQLDRVREVIDELGMRQIIIVSHEQKIEGFVGNVIRLHKNEHVSSVA